MSACLEGLRILTLAEQYPGPYATLLLADLGADVVIVERPEGGDPARMSPIFHAALNRNKRSITLDLKADADKASLVDLIRTADVFMEGYRPGTMERLGFGYSDVSSINSRIIYASISGFGQGGPYRDRPAHDLSYQAIAGLLAPQTLNGSSGSPTGLAIGDLSSGMFAVIGILSALLQRARTNRGQHVDVSITDGLVSWMSTQLCSIMNGGQNLSPVSEPAYGLFKTSDSKLLSLSIAYEDRFWAALCVTLGIESVAALTRAERVADHQFLRDRIAGVIATDTRANWGRRFDEARVPWGPAHTLEEVAGDEHFAARDIFVSLQTPQGERRYVAQPVVFDGIRPKPTRDAPCLGEHNSELLGADGSTNKITDNGEGHEPRNVL
jgi:crotonobetainyl-CoA:carnitine CoA-transferase CaiB-like acyl-CoA transferase